VIAPDWLGFGQTAKVHDFESKRARMFSHMVRFVEVMALDRAHFVGNSMGGTFLLQLAAESPCRLPIDRLVAISGGGFVPDNEYRQRLLAYDGTESSMVDLLEAVFESPVWSKDPEYVSRRHKLSIAPGAWESVAAARFRSPVAPARSEFGQADLTAYERISAPALIIAGARDRLRMSGYANELAQKIPGAEVVVLPDGGHCPNIEHPADVGRLIVEFLEGRSVNRPGSDAVHEALKVAATEPVTA
jgi:pimeloyl-ACP methyl ester carboxylesterase